MKLKFLEGRLELQGRLSNAPGEQWGKISIRLLDTEIDHTFEVSVGCLLPSKPDVTLAELDDAALSRAAAIFEASAHLLREVPAAVRRERALAEPGDKNWSWR